MFLGLGVRRAVEGWYKADRKGRCSRKSVALHEYLEANQCEQIDGGGQQLTYATSY
jgi:hypothetical protein